MGSRETLLAGPEPSISNVKTQPKKKNAQHFGLVNESLTQKFFLRAPQGDVADAKISGLNAIFLGERVNAKMENSKMEKPLLNFS